ncbi:MAG: nucleotide exchange factor GrpE [Cyclobacteriaceae bacterium]
MKTEDIDNSEHTENKEEPKAENAEEQDATKTALSEDEEEGTEEEEIDEVDKLQVELSEAKDKYLRLYSEFENFRRRTAKERLDLIKTANQDLMVALLPVLDDLERAMNAAGDQEAKALVEGMELIQQKFSKILNQKGLKLMPDGVGKDFDAELHEAISQIPAPKKKLKNKIVDVVEKGYLLEDKVIRYAKVVIGT